MAINDKMLIRKNFFFEKQELKTEYNHINDNNIPEKPYLLYGQHARLSFRS